MLHVLVLGNLNLILKYYQQTKFKNIKKQIIFWGNDARNAQKLKKYLTDFTEFTWIHFKNNPKETESWKFRFKKRNVIPTFTERLINRIQPFFVEV